ncbi:hypothetical protein [Bacillus sp. CBEL-1]|uniref:hypothetical protein n=1 Tax=Bacillus sp. CBEL-1 TaxID=2502980 RepID=UPI002570C940|nr:hypothetical protein [Bacillus sp. CBEL-1]
MRTTTVANVTKQAYHSFKTAPASRTQSLHKTYTSILDSTMPRLMPELAPAGPALAQQTVRETLQNVKQQAMQMITPLYNPKVKRYQDPETGRFVTNPNVERVKKPVGVEKKGKEVERVWNVESVQGVSRGMGKETYQHLKDYKNNKYFTRSVEYNAGKDGTGFTYKVYQRGDINWDMVRTKGAKKGRGLTNAEASAKYGLAPILDEAGSVATLHHSQQKGVGPLYEASTRYHNIANAKRAPLHPYKGKLNPFYPMDETTRGAFQKVGSINYWKIRGEEVLGGG